MDKGLIEGLTISGSEVRYDADVSQHAHFMCESCARVFDVKNFKCPTLKKEIEGHQVNSAQLYLVGQCKTCRRK